MPTKLIHLILLLIILLAGCAPAAAAETPTPLPSRTPTPPSPTPSKTSFWRIVTSTITPTPTPSPNITMTPLPFNACPTTDEDYQYPFPGIVSGADEMLEHILAALNNGITLQNLQNGMDQVVNESMQFNYGGYYDEDGNPIIDVIDLSKFKNHDYTIAKHDFTGDGVMEILFLSETGSIPLMETLNVFACEWGKYHMSLEQKYSYRKNFSLLDLNNDTIPEIILHKNMDNLHGPRVLYIYEWDGEKFRNLALPNKTFYSNPDGFETGICSKISEFKPNENGNVDIIIRGTPCDFAERSFTGPYRY